MTKTSDDSVLANLSDLFEMEADRRVAEATARAREQAEAQARREREREAHERAIREARSAERRRMEEERATKDAALDERIAKLRAQLDAVQQEREAARLEMRDALARPPERSSRAGWIATAMAALSLVAAVGAIWVSWPPAPELGPLPERVVAVEPAPLDSPPSAEEELPAEEEVTPAPTEVATAEPAPRPRPRPRPQAPQPRTPDLASQLDLAAGDEVLGDDFLQNAGN